MEEIDVSSALQLQYLQAVIKEGMRIFPASSQGIPRLSLGITVDGFWVPSGVCHAQTHLNRNTLHVNCKFGCADGVLCQFMDSRS